MGKKRIVKKTEEELIKERESAEQSIQKKIDKPTLKKVLTGKVYINATYNNTIITLGDEVGNVLAWASAGAMGFRGTKKSTPFAASKVAEVIAERIKKIGMNEVSVLMKGIGKGRESALRSLGNRDIDIISIKDVTPIPHNGCRPRKVRRV